MSMQNSVKISSRTGDETVAGLLHFARHREPIGFVTGIEATLSCGDPKRSSKYMTCGWSLRPGPAVAALCL